VSLNIRGSTVKFHLLNVFSKLRVNRRGELRDKGERSDIWRQLLASYGDRREIATELLPKRVIFEPSQHFVGTFIGRKHWIKDLLDAAISNDQCQPLQEPHSACGKRGQSQDIAQLESGVTENLKWKVEALGHLALVLGSLCT